MNVLMYFAEYCSSRGDPIGGGGGGEWKIAFFLLLYRTVDIRTHINSVATSKSV